jgi:hypothetical protein
MQLGIRLELIGDRSGYCKNWCIDLCLYGSDYDILSKYRGIIVYMKRFMIYFLNTDGINVYMKVIMV